MTTMTTTTMTTKPIFVFAFIFSVFFTFVLNLVGSIAQVYIFKSAQEKNVHNNCPMGVMGWTNWGLVR